MSQPTPAPQTVHPRTTALPQAVLWDMDGTLVDTEPYWIGSEIAMAEEAGGSWTHEQGLQLVGWPIARSAQVLREQGGVRGTDEEIATALVGRVAGLVRRQGPPWRPGARELLEALGAAGVPCALVTASYTELAMAVLDVLPTGTFTAVVTGDEVTHSKPHPEPYLTAAQRLGVDITACVAIEDSPPGVASAEAAGAQVIAVPLLIDIPEAPGRSRLRSLEGVTLDDLATIAAGTPVQRG